MLLLNGTHDRETSGFSASSFVTAITDALNRTYGDSHNCLKNFVSEWIWLQLAYSPRYITALSDFLVQIYERCLN